MGMSSQQALKDVIGTNIRLARESRKLTQEQLCERVGLSPRGLSSIENGFSLPKISTLLSLSDALSTDTEHLLRKKKRKVPEGNLGQKNWGCACNVKENF